MGITTFIVVQFAGIRANGPIGYLKHFAGPVWYFAVLMFPLELVSECVKPLSLSFRLYGNIFGKDKIIEELMIMGGYIPIQAPILFLGVLVAFLQAFIFTALSSVYLYMITAHGDEH
jgi:F-type H+-transporting ATPase subunit a